MPDRPIPFIAPMVRALLEGRKTQTRRVLNPQPFIDAMGNVADTDGGGTWLYGQHPDGRPNWANYLACRFRIAPGDRLWVKEAWRTHKDFDHLKPRELLGHAEKLGRGVPIWPELSLKSGSAEDRALVKSAGRYRHARFMPRWASSTTLLVEQVRVQRLQDIGETDSRAEGIGLCVQFYGPPDPDWQHPCLSAREAFATLWQQLHGPDAWAANPWVAAITFEVVRANIDAVERSA